MFPFHHILAQRFSGHRVVRFLAGDFNIEAIGNLMALPPKQSIADNLSSSPHTGGHLGTYYKGFRKYLNTVEQSSRYSVALRGDTSARRELVSDLNGFVAAAKYALANGHLFANTPRGMTREEANERNSKWFDNWRKYAAENRLQIDQMQETIGQLSNAGRLNDSLLWPILSPTSELSLEERIAVAKQHLTDGVPISLQSTAVGPVPGLQGLIPSLVDTRSRGFSSPDHSDLNEKEGLTPSDPRFSDGLPAFPAPSSDEQRLSQLPPSIAMPPEPQVLQFHPETSQPLTYLSDGSPVLGPDPNKMTSDPNEVPAVLAGMAILGAAMAAPALIPLLPIAALGLAGAAAAHAEPARDRSGRASLTGASPPPPLLPAHDANVTDGHPFGLLPAAAQGSNNSFDQGPTQAGTVADRFGRWTDTPAGSVPAQNAQEVSAAPAAEAVGREEVRRLTRTNASTAGSVFTSGSAPIPYLPSSEFNDRYGDWHIPAGESRPQTVSMPISMFADQPSYTIPPPIFGGENVGIPRDDAEEWFSRWIGPLLPPK